MSLISIAIYITICLLILAFCWRIIVAFFQFIYEIAPAVLPVLALAAYLYYSGELDCGFKEMEAKYENYIGAIKD